MMRLCLLFGPMSMNGRSSYDFTTVRTVPGHTGTDLTFTRVAEELQALGHDVELIVPSEQTSWRGKTIRREPKGHYDGAIAVNEPDLLRGVDATVRTAAMLLNDLSFCRAGFDRYVDLFFSPSQAHLDMVRTKPGWRRVEVSQQNPRGVEVYKFDPARWLPVHLGCDPDRYGTMAPGTPDESPHWVPSKPKIPGRVVYSSSPDRGLHHLLSQWPRIRRAVPHATLHIFYRLAPWIEQIASTPYPFPPVEALRARALYINEALNRMLALPGQCGITVRDSVSRETIEAEMAQAECLAYPCDTIRWSEGFSCSLLEGCAARACPVTLQTDAFPDVYGGTVPMVARECVTEWGDLVIRALTDSAWRDAVNERCGAFAAQKTWRHTAENMVNAIEAEMARKRVAA